MSTPEHPETPQLTRKQLRDIRNTGSTPIIDSASNPVIGVDAVPLGAQADQTPVVPPPIEESLTPVAIPTPAAPLARAAEPVLLPEPPAADRSIDLGVAPLTRRQARQQERIRTASVPVITPELSAAYAAQSLVGGSEVALTQVDDSASVDVESAEDVVAELVSDVQAELESPEAHPEHHEGPDEENSQQSDDSEMPEKSSDADEPVADAEPAQEVARTVTPEFGAALLAGGGPTDPEHAPSFDDLITRSSSGSVATPNALILTQVPDGGSIVAPVTATGEVLITGTFNLPEGLGSTGHALGTADGKETDAVLVDGELPAHSSPTPIAASAAISTGKQPGEIIKPPAPEKGGKLMLTLAITAGVLALALVGVLILAVTTGVF